jgi:2-polyprenyl-3-methyl-5-hydroxy-6-metoxy-1,4-benzoquinol methylase
VVTEFRSEPLLAIVRWIETAPEIVFRVLDPDRARGHYAGEIVDGCVHRPWRVWTDLAERMGLRMLTPRPAEPPLVELRFERLGPRWQPRGEGSERYGVGSGFERIRKLEDPGFVIDLEEALARVALVPGGRVLDLGCNTGDVLAMMPPGAQLVGVDHSASAIAAARTRVPDATLVEADVRALPPLGRFDLVVSIGLLQSGALDDRALVRHVVQELLAPAGAVIFGWPNCRYVDGEVEYGARMKNFTEPELGLVIKDIAFYRKYLQQHHRQVFVTGKNYLLVTGVSTPTPAA